MLPSPASGVSAPAAGYVRQQEDARVGGGVQEDRPDDVARHPQREVHADAEREGVDHLQRGGEDRLAAERVADVQSGEDRGGRHGDDDLGVAASAHEVHDEPARQQLLGEADAESGEEPRGDLPRSRLRRSRGSRSAARFVSSTTATAIHIHPRPRIGCGPKSSRSHPIDQPNSTSSTPPSRMGSAVREDDVERAAGRAGELAERVEQPDGDRAGRDRSRPPRAEAAFQNPPRSQNRFQGDDACSLRRRVQWRVRLFGVRFSHASRLSAPMSAARRATARPAAAGRSRRSSSARTARCSSAASGSP